MCALLQGTIKKYLCECCTTVTGKLCTANGSFKVDIAVLTDPGGSPSIDNYLGSTTTVVCHVENTMGPVSYHWSSTNSNFFAYNSTAMFNRKRLLSAADAGVHTCTVTDAQGNTGQASLTMMFKGISMLNVYGLF